MARIRTVKPEFFRHEGIFEAEKESGLPLRIAFVGLWTCADREGRFRWRPRQLKLDCLPYDDCDMSRVLDALMTRGFVVRYEIAGEVYGSIPSFTKHQVVNNRESPSDLPDIPDPQDCLENIITNNGLTRDGRVVDANDTRGALTHAGEEGEQEGEEKILVDKILRPIEKPERVSTSAQKALIRSVGDAWNELAAEKNLTQIADLHNGRQANILARSEDLVKIFDFRDPLTGFKNLFDRIRGSPFLRGDVQPRDGSLPFRCDFNFAFKKASFTNIMEGKYEDRPKGQSGR